MLNNTIFLQNCVILVLTAAVVSMESELTLSQRMVPQKVMQQTDDSVGTLPLV